MNSLTKPLRVLFLALILCPFIVKAETGTLKLGVLACQTGPCAETGTNSIRGIRLAVDEINKAGGVLGKTLEIAVEDTREGETASHTISAFQRLLLDKDIHYFIGPTWSTGGVPAIPLVKKREDILVVSPTLGVAEFNEASDRIFNVWPHDKRASQALAGWAHTQGYKTAAILSAPDPWATQQAKVFQESFRDHGGEILLELVPPQTVTDLRAEALKIKNANPDAVFIVIYNHIVVAARDLRALGYEGALLSPQMDAERKRQGGPAFNGLVYASFVSPTKSFVKDYTLFHSTDPGIGSDTSYDAVHALRLAIENAGTVEVNKVKETLLALELEGASGTIKFDKTGGVTRQARLYQIDSQSQKEVSYE